MKADFIPYLDGVLKKGIAVGMADIVNDEMTFRYKDEFFTFSCVDAIDIARYNGYWYEARIEKVRKLARGKH